MLCTCTYNTFYQLVLEFTKSALYVAKHRLLQTVMVFDLTFSKEAQKVLPGKQKPDICNVLKYWDT